MDTDRETISYLIGQRIQGLRKQRKMSQEELALRLIFTLRISDELSVVKDVLQCRHFLKYPRVYKFLCLSSQMLKHHSSIPTLKLYSVYKTYSAGLMRKKPY